MIERRGRKQREVVDSDHLSVARRSMELEGRWEGAGGMRGVREWCKAKYVAHCDRSLTQYAAVLFTD